MRTGWEKRLAAGPGFCRAGASVSSLGSFLSGLEFCTNLLLLLALEGGDGVPGGAPRSTPTPTRRGDAAAQVHAQEDAQLPRPHQRCVVRCGSPGDRRAIPGAGTDWL